jgi:hypothetical protein
MRRRRPFTRAAKRAGTGAGVSMVMAMTSMIAVTAVPTAGQQASVWLELNAAHSRPPSGTALDAANYGLLGGRLRVERKRSAFEVGATHGRGAEDGSGGWLSGRAAYDAARVNGRLDYGLRLEGSGLTYLSPVRIGADDEYKQTLASGTVRPFAGLSIAGFRLGAEGTVTRGAWRSEVSTPLVNPGPGLPVPGGGDRGQRQTLSAEGSVGIIGGAASLLRILGPATVELRAGSYDAQNQAVDGRYTGVDATLALTLGALDVTFAGRHWATPADSTETGGHVGVGIALGSAAYLQAVAGRIISDPVFGTPGGTGLSIGLNVRVGRRNLGPPAPARVGDVSSGGRAVRFTLARRDARTVAVAGDFSGWELRSLQRGADGVWTLDTVLEPGVYHYAFVIDGETWMVPDNASGIVDDGFGRRNATLIVNQSEGTP